MRNDLIVEASIIDGEYVVSENFMDILSPYDYRYVGRVPLLAENHINQAIQSSSIALKIWSQKTAKERSIILRAWYEAIVENIDSLAIILTLEQGKPLLEAKTEIKYAASFIEWFAEEAKRIYGDIISSPIKDTKIIVTRQPIGVCVAITPWNFPAAMITRKVGAALAAGCSMIVKPASKTPLTALALAKLALEAGLPKGVFNVVTGKADLISDIFCKSSVVKKISFTGSTEIGKKLMAASADNLKRLSLELGGNAPFIVLKDADLENAVKGLMAAKFRNAGQSCVASNRIFVHNDIHNKFVSLLGEAIKTIHYGNGLDYEVNQGPLIDNKSIVRTEELIEDAKKLGAKIIVGGKRDGNCFMPTIITNIASEMQIYQTEIFAPVVSIIKFETLDKLIQMANDTQYGLAAYIYSENQKKAWELADKLEVGMVAINQGILSLAEAPFGGIKESGFGREGSYLGIEEYLNVKYMLV